MAVNQWSQPIHNIDDMKTGHSINIMNNYDCQKYKNKIGGPFR